MCTQVKREVIDDVSQPSSVAGDYSSREHMSLRVLCDRSQPSLSGDMCSHRVFIYSDTFLVIFRMWIQIRGTLGV
jgi:hypothetical protein